MVGHNARFLHEPCMPWGELDHVPMFLQKILFKSVPKFFSAFASRSRFGAAVSVAAERSFFVFCNSVFANRSGKAAYRFLAAAAVCVILLSFATESPKSYCSGCSKVKNGVLQLARTKQILSVKTSLCKSLLGKSFSV